MFCTRSCEAARRAAAQSQRDSHNSILCAASFSIPGKGDGLLFSNNLAAALVELGRYDEGFSMCQQLLDRRHLIEHAAPDGATDEKVARTLGRMASCLEQQQKYDEALILRRQAAETHDSPQTQAAIADCERLLGHAG